MEKNEILKIYGSDYKEMTLQILERASLRELLPENKDSKICIKPNILGPNSAKSGATTHTEIVAGIIEYLKKAGYRNLVVAEGSWVGARTGEAVRFCGYDRLCEHYQVPFFDTQKDSSFEKDCAGMKLHLCSCVKDFDFLINVPVLKGHCQTRITCALKNMKGLIPNSEKRRFHTLGLHKPIAHLGAGISQDFIVVDNICGDLDFEEGGNPVVHNCIMTARDPVLVDAYVCRMLDYRIEEVPYVKIAESLGVGSADIDDALITVCGEAPEPDGALRAAGKVVEVEDAVSEVESCSACYAYLIPALNRLREEGLLDRLNEKICIGQGYQGKTGEIGIGRCTRLFRHSLAGCPPLEHDIYAFLKDLITNKN